MIHFNMEAVSVEVDYIKSDLCLPFPWKSRHTFQEEVHPLAVSGAHGVETEATDISDMDLGIRYTWK